MDYYVVYGLEPVALTEHQQRMLRVCNNNWVSRIAGVYGMHRCKWRIYGLEPVALTEHQQRMLHVCNNNWVSRIAGIYGVHRCKWRI